ncbi:endonuclease [Vibrio phage K225]
MKTCTKCRTEKSPDEFYNSSSSKDGKMSQCKECRNAHVRNWSKKNRDKQKEAKDKSRKSNQHKANIRWLTGHHLKKMGIEPQCCSVFNCNAEGEAHHINYDSWKNFIWLCKRHHSEVHNNGTI